jgi:hypothetical protein
MRVRSVLGGLILGLSGLACRSEVGPAEGNAVAAPTGTASIETDGNRIWLASGGSADGTFQVDVEYARAATTPGARVAEIVLQRSANLAFDGSSAGTAAAISGKTVVAQEKEGNRLRLIVYSNASISRMDSGVLATLRFTKRGTEPARLEIVPSGPILAPQEASEGLRVGDPLVL